MRPSHALALAAFSASAEVLAQPSSRPVALVGEVRGSFGNDDVAGLNLGLAGAGAELNLAPSLRVRALALGVVPFGTTPDGREAHGGAGGELGLRLTPFSTWRVRPFASWSAGLLFFPRTPFLPRGDIYEFILSFGLGVDVALSERVTLGAQLQYTHLSNGQGLGPHNPAFDGVTGVISVATSVGAPRPTPDVWQSTAPTTGDRARFVPGVLADAAVGRIGDAVLATGRVRAFWQLSPIALAGVDVAGGALAGEGFVDVGVLGAAHWTYASVGGRAGYRSYAGLDTLSLEAQVEGHLSPEVTLLAMGSYEHTAHLGHVARAAVGVRVFPLRSLTLDLGVGFDRIGDAPLGDASDPYFGVEWQLPVGAPDWQLSLFLERQVSTVDLLGVRVAWGMGPALRDVARRSGWRQVR